MYYLLVQELLPEQVPSLAEERVQFILTMFIAKELRVLSLTVTGIVLGSSAQIVGHMLKTLL